MTEKELLDRIKINPEIMFGKPVIRGTRLTIDLILEKLAYGRSEQEIIKEYPFLKLEDIRAAILYAAKVISLEEEIAVEHRFSQVL